MSGQSEDDLWRSIVENYGERAQVGPAPEPEEPAAEPDWFTGADDPSERFVPPTPPPVPQPPPVRMAAWLGVFGAPAVLLVALVLGLPLPSPLGYVLIGCFMGGFGYLVVHMDRTPRDPGDDGAVV